MNSILIYISMLVTICSTIILAFYFISFTIKKSKNQAQEKNIRQHSDQLRILDEIIETSVIAVNQKMVLESKRTNNFLQQDKEEAFHECKSIIYKAASANLIDELSKTLGSLDEWINFRIEYHVRKNK